MGTFRLTFRSSCRAQTSQPRDRTNGRRSRLNPPAFRFKEVRFWASLVNPAVTLLSGEAHVPTSRFRPPGSRRTISPRPEGNARSTPRGRADRTWTDGGGGHRASLDRAV